MVRGSRDGLNSPDLGELLENFGCELRSTVRCDRRGDAEILNPSRGEGVDDTLGGNVCNRDRHWPSSEAVDHCEEMPVSV